MQMNQTPSSERVHIGFFGRRNAGKSSVLNAVTGQDLAELLRKRWKIEMEMAKIHGAAPIRTGRCH